MSKFKKIKISDIFEMIIVLALTIIIDLALTSVGMGKSTVVAVNILGIVAVALRLQSIGYSLVYATISVLMFDFFFLAPQYSFGINREYVISFIVMIIVAYLISSISAQFKISSEAKRQAEQETEREKLRYNLLRGIGHDLRTPLTGIIGNASLLADNDSKIDPKRRVELANDIVDDAVWLRTLIENALTITKINDIDSSKPITNLTYELVDDIINDALAHIDRRADEHNITVDCDYMLLVKVDTNLFSHVIINLVNNAIKYTPKGSNIVISAFRCDTLKGRIIVIRVSDDGPGISDELKGTVFGKFVTTSKGGGDGSRGMGLGLALCKDVIRLHNGTITVKDNIPHGAIFEIHLPAVIINEEGTDE